MRNFLLALVLLLPLGLQGAEAGGPPQQTVDKLFAQLLEVTGPRQSITDVGLELLQLSRIHDAQ